MKIKYDAVVRAAKEIKDLPEEKRKKAIECLDKEDIKYLNRE